MPSAPRPLRAPAPAWLVCLALTAGVLAVYAQVRDFAFVNFDDPAYVYDNEHTRAGITAEGVRWAFSSGYESNWLPLTRLSHMLDGELFGLDAGAHHLVNVFWHLANTLLVFGVLRVATGAFWRSAFVAAVFAVHPAHAESVAWVSERKDVLSTFFGLLAIGAYARWTRAPRPALFAAALLAFAASLMSKQMLVTLPIVLLLLDVWPLGRLAASPLDRRELWARVREKLPFLAIAFAAGCVTLAVQWAGGSVLSVEARPLGARLANALVSYLRYVAHLLWPADLTFFYPYRPLGAAAAVGAGVVLAAATLVAVRLRRSRPYVLVGWLWYLVTLLPVIGLVQVGDQALADRFTYFPSIGLCLIVAWGVPDLLAGGRRRDLALAGAAGSALALYAAAGFRQVGVWRDSETLLTHALAIAPDNHIAHNNLGWELLKRGRIEEARARFAAALELAPQNPRAHLNMGYARLAEGDPAAALPHIEASLRLRPERPDAHQALGDALARLGRLTDAAAHYRRAIALGAAAPDAYNNLGVALAAGGDIEGALDAYLAAVALDPEYASARANAAFAYAELGRIAEAIAQLEIVVRLHPEDEEARVRLEDLARMRD